jgi:hypothetical protein
MEPWLRGPLPGVHPLLAPVMYTLQQVREDLGQWTEGLADDEVWLRPRGLAPLGFQIRHIAGSTDRLITYAAGSELSAEQLAALKQEMEPGERLAALLGEVDGSFDRARAVISALDPAELPRPREVGRKRLPTSVAGLLHHTAEHAQRHLGLAIATIKVLRS